jgi:hypothetical protein
MDDSWIEDEYTTWKKVLNQNGILEVWIVFSKIGNKIIIIMAVWIVEER